MTTYFAWVQEREKFDPNTHCRCEMDILEMTIDHREGEVAIATLMVAQSTIPPWDRRHVFIASGDTLIFSGRLIGLPVQTSQELMTLEFTSEPLDAAEQLQKMAGELKISPYWDVSFVDPFEQDNPAEWLEARSALFAWDRTQGIVSLSDLFEGRITIDFTDDFFADSLRVRLAETPLSSITINLTMEWVQHAQGEVSLGQKIAAGFPGGMVNTLTPQALKAKWFQEGQKLGRTGYWVEKSHLEVLTPPRTGILDIYPTLTPEFMSWDEASHKPIPTRAQRFWLSATLVLGWCYRQKRRERVQMTLIQKTQLDGRIHPLKRQLNLRLQQISCLEGATFFLTSRGRQAIEHALEIGRAHLAASARCLEIEVTIPFEAGFSLSLDQSIRLSDPRIPGGEVTGKVIAYRLHQDGLKAEAWVRFVASIGGNAEEIPTAQPTFYVDPHYADTALPSHFQTPSGLVYESYYNQQPSEGLVNADGMTVNEILRQVLVSHDAESQIRVLQKQQYPIRDNLVSVLEEIPTQVSLDLLSLKTSDVAEHAIIIHPLTAYSAPNQVNLTRGLK